MKIKASLPKPHLEWAHEQKKQLEALAKTPLPSAEKALLSRIGTLLERLLPPEPIKPDKTFKVQLAYVGPQGLVVRYSQPPNLAVTVDPNTGAIKAVELLSK